MNRSPCASTKASGKFSLNTGTNAGSATAAPAHNSPITIPMPLRKARNGTSASVVVRRQPSETRLFRKRSGALKVMAVRPFAVIAAFAFQLGTPAIARPPVEATYVNPVLDADFPDPTVIKAGDGFYYAYGTQTQRGGKWINIQ